MKNKVTRFPQPRHAAREMPSDDPMILFTLGDQRFAIQWIVTEVSGKPAEVISMQKQRRPKKKPRSTQTLNDQTFRLRHVTVYTALERFILGTR